MLPGCLLVGRIVDAQALCVVQVWNMQTGQQHDLPGHQAEVLALATTAGMLFSGGKDGSIRAWQFDAASATFRPTVRTLPDLTRDRLARLCTGETLLFQEAGCHNQQGILCTCWIGIQERHCSSHELLYPCMPLLHLAQNALLIVATCLLSLLVCFDALERGV